MVCEPPMYGRLLLGQSSTTATHQPDETTRATPASRMCQSRRRKPVGAAIR